MAMSLKVSGVRQILLSLGATEYAVPPERFQKLREVEFFRHTARPKY